jgi:uncharacterized protein (TIGR02466 family)
MCYVTTVFDSKARDAGFFSRQLASRLASRPFRSPKERQHSVTHPPPVRQIAPVFATLIGRFQYQETEKVNSELHRLILDRERTTPSDDYANLGGWHSPSDFLEWQGDAVATLRTWISDCLNQMVGATYQLPEVQGRSLPSRGGFMVHAWANISRSGNYHRMHNHPSSCWSGCYYVSSSSQANSLAGVLEFYDPRPFTEMVYAPGTPYGQRMLVRPVPGLMVLFPSWLYHFVHPCNSEEPRISIAFNASWKSQ